MSAEQSQELHIALLERDMQTLKEEMAAQKAVIAALQLERDKALKWGIATLGALVLSLGMFIVNLAKDHLK